MNEFVEKVMDKLPAIGKHSGSAKYKLEQLIKEYDQIEVEDSIHNYLNQSDKPDFWKWYNEWKRFRTNIKAYKDDRPVQVMNEVLFDMEHRMQWYMNNKDLGFYARVNNFEDLNNTLEYFVIEKSGKVDLKASYIQQFYDFIYEKMNEKIKPELWKMVQNIGIENIISIYLRDAYFDLMNWKKSVSDLMDYPMTDIVESVLANRLLKMDFIAESISKITNKVRIK